MLAEKAGSLDLGNIRAVKNLCVKAAFWIEEYKVIFPLFQGLIQSTKLAADAIRSRHVMVRASCCSKRRWRGNQCDAPLRKALKHQGVNMSED